MNGPAYDVTQILQEWGEGDREAVVKLMPLVFMRNCGGRVGLPAP